MKSRRKWRRSFDWVNTLKAGPMHCVHEDLRSLEDEEICSPSLQVTLCRILEDTVRIICQEVGFSAHGFRGIGLGAESLRESHPTLRYNGLTILRILTIFLQDFTLLVWEARAIVRIWREICCGKNGYPYPRRSQQQFHGQTEFLTFCLPRLVHLCGKVPPLAMQHSLREAIHKCLLSFTEDGRYVLGYSCTDHLGGSPRYPLWHVHVNLGMHRLIAKDKERLLALRNKDLGSDEIWPFLRGNPLFIAKRELHETRLQWRASVEQILGGRAIEQRKDMVIKRDRKAASIQTKIKDTTRLGFYISAVCRDPYRFIFRVSQNRQTVKLEPRTDVKWRNKPKAPFIEPLEIFVRGRVFSPLANVMRRSCSGYMHHNNLFFKLILRAQKLKLLENRPADIAARGHAAAAERGWI